MLKITRIFYHKIGIHKRGGVSASFTNFTSLSVIALMINMKFPNSTTRRRGNNARLSHCPNAVTISI